MDEEKAYLIVRIGHKKKKEDPLPGFNMIYRVDEDKILVTNDEVEVARYLKMGNYKIFDISSLQQVKFAEVNLK